MAEDSALSDAGTRCFAVFQRGAEPDTVRLRLRGSLSVAVLCLRQGYFSPKISFSTPLQGAEGRREAFSRKDGNRAWGKEKKTPRRWRAGRMIPPFLMPGGAVLPCFRGGEGAGHGTAPPSWKPVPCRFVPETRLFLSKDQVLHPPAGRRRPQGGLFPQRR